MPSSLGHRVARAAACLGAIIASAGASAQLTEERVLLLYNSQNAESLAVRNAYLAARPGVLEFDLDDSTLPTGQITRAVYLTRVRDPLRAFLSQNDGDGQPLAQRVIAIATTRGLPARIAGANEFTTASTHASVESELSLLWQDLEQAGQAALPFRYAGPIDNPYHTRLNQTITGFARTGITTQRAFTYVTPGAWQISGLTPGDMYLVCRLDAAPLGGASAVDNAIALIGRSQDLTLDPCEAQALLDEYGCPEQLDNNSFTALFPGRDDFALTAPVMSGLGVLTTHDQTAAFLTQPDLPDPSLPLVLLATYGENHDVNACGENPPGTGTYPDLYDFHPAAIFLSYESFNGESIVNGMSRQGQAQALDAIALGASFTVAHVREPFTFAVADAEWLTRNLYLNGLTFAEAAYSSIPALSWQNTPVGDPLARVGIGPSLARLDANDDGVFDILDLYAQNASPSDANCDGVADADDIFFTRDLLREGEREDILTGTDR